MNFVAACVRRNAEDAADVIGRPVSQLSWVALTPRFRTSAHVVFLGLSAGRDPVLVAKVSRLPGRSDLLDHEAANLVAVQGARPGGFDSVPRLVANEVVAGTHVLLETGVAGHVPSAREVHRDRRGWTGRLLSWITEMHLATVRHGGAPPATFARLLSDPLLEFERLGSIPDADRLADRTRALTRPIGQHDLPLALQHGDLSAPNVLVTPEGGVGIVDWELAQPGSLPAQDLFFALAYLAFARARARRVEEYVAAFDAAFFTRGAWAVPHVESYAAALGIPREAMRPLFVACWCRYVIIRGARLRDTGSAPLGAEASAWLVQDRFYALWQHTVRHIDRLHLTR